MNLWERGRILAQIGRAGWSWLRHDTGLASPVPDNPKFKSARDAVGLIRDGDVIADSGLGGQQRCSILYWAIREAFEQSGHPARLTVVNVGGHGGRGKVPGTLEELARPGLCTRLITSHFETFKAILDLAEKGKCELQCLPLGTMTHLFEGLGRGEDSLVSSAGVGTFLDPRIGTGSPVGGTSSEHLITAEGDRLRYRMPAIDVALFNLPAADRWGNLYVRNCATIGESRELAMAARRNGGKVIANVGMLVDDGYDDIFLPADLVDAVVVHPSTEQTAAIFHTAPWRVFTLDSDMTTEEGMERIRFINQIVGVGRKRSEADEVLARLAAATLLDNAPSRARVSIGTGMPEDIPRIVHDSGRLDDVTFMVESGVVGGVPVSGAFFGSALCPEQIISSAELFHLCHERLDAACLGALEVDGQGNVNVSRRGDGTRGYVGPGGFIDFAEHARTIVFVSAWMRGGEIRARGNHLDIVARGAPKFVERVAEITFDGARALQQGKTVLYVTHTGVFRLTKKGLELASVVPGIDVQRDILDFVPMKIALPASGEVPRATWLRHRS